MADKILSFLEQHGTDSFDEETAQKFKQLLSSDQIIGKEVEDYQISKGKSVALLVVGLICFGLILQFFPISIKNGINAMDLVQVASVISWSIFTFTLLGITWQRSEKKEDKSNLYSART